MACLDFIGPLFVPCSSSSWKWTYPDHQPRSASTTPRACKKCCLICRQNLLENQSDIMIRIRQPPRLQFSSVLRSRLYGPWHMRHHQFSNASYPGPNRTSIINMFFEAARRTWNRVPCSVKVRVSEGAVQRHFPASLYIS